MTERTKIRVIAAHTHNLRGITVAIPRRALTVVTGVSGSGKSSLAFDTLYAEGQRRYVESMSTYARQFLERMQRPDVEAVEGVPPAVAIEQRNGTKNARSTVGTATEIADYLRLLYAKIGEAHCPRCGRPIERTTPQTAVAALLSRHEGTRAHVVAEVDADTREVLQRDGWNRLFDGKDVCELAAWERQGALPVLIDRLVLRPRENARLAEAIATGWRLAEGVVAVHIEDGPRLRFREGMRCDECGQALRPPQPSLFSYNSPLGACETCQGFGRTTGLDLAKAIPDGRLSLAQGAIAPWRTEKFSEWQEWLEEWAKKRAFHLPLDTPWNELTEPERERVLGGFGEFTGLRGWFRYLEGKRYKMHYRILLARYRAYAPCVDCGATRLRPEGRSYRVGGRTISELEAMTVADLRQWMAALSPKLSRQLRTTAALLLRELDARLDYLETTGLGYLTLSRTVRTLSGGEAQRIHLAQALGAQLTDTLYVLDEPSVGLHPRDTGRLLEVLRTLTQRGNTVVVVEHDADFISAADQVIDLGPGAGAHGGQVLYEGTPVELLPNRDSATAQALRRRRLPLGPRRTARRGVLTIRGARAHNLRNVTVDLPLGLFTCISGVSGSGKSSLLIDVLYANWLRHRKGGAGQLDSRYERGDCDGLEGTDAIDDVILVDQSPLARSSRSNPATYLGAWTEIRKLLARTERARQLGLPDSAFSFNAAGGRCEACRGQGTVTLEMHFLADVAVVCDACQGRRFSERTLGVRLHGKNVAELLDLSIEEALALFADVPRIVRKLLPFAEVGLGYLRLGQPTSTLSGGEAQRLKLAAYLADPTGKRPLFLFDEPTTGLHLADVEVLLGVLRRICQAGGTVVCIEHNLDFLCQADHLVELGPEGGQGGGRVVATGTPEEVARTATHTGRHLARLLRGKRRAVRG